MVLEKFGLTARILLGMLLGIGVGMYAGAEAAPLGGLGKLLIQLVKAVAVPLVFFAILEAIISTQIPKSSIGRLLGIVAINSFCAIVIALSLANFCRPGLSLKEFTGVTKAGETAAKKLEFTDVVSGYIPESFIKPFVENNVAAVVILAILIGAAARKISGDQEGASAAVHYIYRLLEQILRWLVTLIPIAAFGVTAKAVGEYGFAPFKGLAFYVLVCLLGLALQIAFVYMTWIRVIAGIPLRRFFREASPALTYAFGTNSSLATLPLTLSTLDKLGVSKGSSRLGACVGTNLNNDGILLYEALAALIVAQALGIELSLGEQITAALLSVVAAIGVAGVPEAGIISLSLVLATLGLPLELLPLLLTVDWIVARARSVTNVLSDMTVSIAIDAAPIDRRIAAS